MKLPPPYNAEGTGEGEEGEETGEGGYEVGGDDVVAGEAYVVAADDGGDALRGEEEARGWHEGLHAEAVGAAEDEGAQEVTRGVEEECAGGGEEAVGVAEAMGGGDEGEGEREGCSEHKHRAAAVGESADEPIEEFGDEEDAEEPDGSGEPLPEEAFPPVACAGHEERGEGGEDEGEEDGGQQELAHALLEEGKERGVAVGIEAHAADEEEQGHVEGVDEDAGDGLAIDAMAHDNEDDAEALGYVEGDVTILHVVY